MPAAQQVPLMQLSPMAQQAFPHARLLGQQLLPAHLKPSPQHWVGQARSLGQHSESLTQAFPAVQHSPVTVQAR